MFKKISVILLVLVFIGVSAISAKGFTLYSSGDFDTELRGYGWDSGVEKERHIFNPGEVVYLLNMGQLNESHNKLHYNFEINSEVWGQFIVDGSVPIDYQEQQNNSVIINTSFDDTGLHFLDTRLLDGRGATTVIYITEEEIDVEEDNTFESIEEIEELKEEYDIN